MPRQGTGAGAVSGGVGRPRGAWLLLLSALWACGGPDGAPVGGEAGPSASPGPDAPGVTLLVVRHAERLDDSRDPPLSDEGAVRAEELARVLEFSDVKGIAVTQYRRTHDTAAPLAQLLGITPREIPIESGDMDSFLDQVREWGEEYGSGTLLLVGHSNVLRPALERFAGATMDEPHHDQYGDLLILQNPFGPGAPSSLRLQFGR